MRGDEDGRWLGRKKRNNRGRKVDEQSRYCSPNFRSEARRPINLRWRSEI
jgi:hypothetical protein